MPASAPTYSGTVAARSGRAAIILEKDIWVCWVLQALFSMPDSHPMAFKGGTSLSKVYRIIDRFSEDVDVTLDYRAFNDGFDPFADGASRTQITTLQRTPQGPRRDVHPRRRGARPRAPPTDALAADGQHEIRIGDDGETIRFAYPSAVEDPDGYVRGEVLLEFGGRNVIDPNEQRAIIPDMAALTRDLDYPAAIVTVLSPVRTFWEKATLVHVECHRRRLADHPGTALSALVRPDMPRRPRYRPGRACRPRTPGGCCPAQEGCFSTPGTPTTINASTAGCGSSPTMTSFPACKPTTTQCAPPPSSPTTHPSSTRWSKKSASSKPTRTAPAELRTATASLRSRARFRPRTLPCCVAGPPSAGLTTPRERVPRGGGERIVGRKRIRSRRTRPAVESMYRFVLWLVSTVEKFPRRQRSLQGDRRRRSTRSKLAGLPSIGAGEAEFDGSWIVRLHARRELDGRELHDVALAAYLAELHEAGRASSSASMVVAAASFRSKLAGQSAPTGERTARVLAGYRRTASDRGRGQARPFGISDLAAALAICHQPRRRERGGVSDQLALERGRLDAVIAGLLFMAGLRRSEVSALPWADIVDSTDDDGMLVTVRRSKTNQEGEVNDVRFVKDGVARALRTLRTATNPEPGDRVVPLSAQMIGFRFTAAA